MDDANGNAQLSDALLPIMFTVVAVGLVIIVGVSRIHHFISALIFSVLAAFWSWGLIRVKRLSFWFQRTGRLDRMCQLMPFEIATYLTLLLILLFHVTPAQGNEGMHMHWATVMLQLYLVGLAITGYGMGVFFARGPEPTMFLDRESGVVHFSTIGLGLAVVITGACRTHNDNVGRRAGVSLVVYIWLLLVITCIAGDWY